jgi:hypothetical protein
MQKYFIIHSPQKYRSVENKHQSGISPAKAKLFYLDGTGIITCFDTKKKALVASFHQGLFSSYSTQFEMIETVLSGSSGSFVGMCSWKLCVPPMAPCMKNSIVMVVLSPGPMAIEPTAGVGGQHPSSTSTYGASVIRRVWSPTLVTLTTVRIGFSPSFTSP